MSILDERSILEHNVAVHIRDVVLNAMRERGMSHQEIAERLGLLPSGVAVLMEEEEWSLETAIRVAAGIGVELDIQARVR